MPLLLSVSTLHMEGRSLVQNDYQGNIGVHQKGQEMEQPQEKFNPVQGGNV
jgi:hypothetical protein